MLSILCMGLRLSNLVTENREEDLEGLLNGSRVKIVVESVGF